MKTTQPKTGQPCVCKPGRSRDNCPLCEGTGQRIDFAKIRGEAMPRTAACCLPGDTLKAGPVAGSYRTPDHKAQIDWELKDGENGPEFSACGNYAGGAGQCLDEIARAYPNDPAVSRIVAVWREYHLNDTNAGTPEQEAALEAAEVAAVEQALKLPNPERYFWNFERRELNPHTLGTVAGLKDSSYYAWACHVLKAAGLYEVILADNLTATGGFPKEVVRASELAAWQERLDTRQGIRCDVTGAYLPFGMFAGKSPLEVAALLGRRGYRYGERWIYRAIPAEIIAEIKSWSDFGPGDGRSLGECAADEFLQRNGIRLRVTLSDSKPAQWSPAGHHYRVTLSAKGRRLAFDFWGSVNDAEAGKHPSAYDILYCVSSDIHTPETFEEFCREYGDDSDSIKAKQTFTRANRHAQRLRAFFEADEQKQLSTIN